MRVVASLLSLRVKMPLLVHGGDGLGNIGLTSNRPVQAEHAALALLRMVEAFS